jgi:hypothetical protein
LGSHRSLEASSVGQAELPIVTYDKLASRAGHTYMLHTEMCTLCTENYSDGHDRCMDQVWDSLRHARW